MRGIGWQLPASSGQDGPEDELSLPYCVEGDTLMLMFPNDGVLYRFAFTR